MRVAIVGSRTFHNYDKLRSFMMQYFDPCRISQVISGGADGVDHLAERFAEEHGIDLLIFEADWDKYGKSAGPKRNRQIARASDMVIAFWDGSSKGTRNMLDQAFAEGKPAMVVPV